MVSAQDIFHNDGYRWIVYMQKQDFFHMRVTSLILIKTDVQMKEHALITSFHN